MRIGIDMEKRESEKLLDIHLAEGESQRVEFKEKIPDTVRELAKVIASFATSNTGTIYIGVDDLGNIVGLDGLDNTRGKDEFQQRILGISNMVQPAVRVSIDFLKKNSKNIARIIVPKGSEPVYYVGGIPYLRDLSSSRKATAIEVKELHQKYFERQGFPAVRNAQQLFLTNALLQLSDVQLALSDMEEHHVNPYLQQLMYDLGTSGRSLLDLSADPIASKLALDKELKELGKKLQDMEMHEFVGGRSSWDAFLDKGKKASEIVERILPRIRKNMSTSANSKKDFKDSVKRTNRNLKNEWEIGKEFHYTSELERLRNSFRILGYTFQRLANLPESDFFDNIRQRLLELGRKLRALSTPRFFGYGGTGFDPIQNIKDEVELCIKIGDETVGMLEK
jgi:hypothetical protein